MEGHGRLHGFDLIRLVSMYAIVLFHCIETAFYADVSPMYGSSAVGLYRFIESIARQLVFSGFTVAALSTFLYGSKTRSRRAWLLLLTLLAAGIVVVAWVEGDAGMGSFYWEWDIYPFLLVSLGMLYAVRRSSIAVFALGFIGFALLWLPIWNLVPPPLGEPILLPLYTVFVRKTTRTSIWPCEFPTIWWRSAVPRVTVIAS
jgi:hypothetical protein